MMKESNFYSDEFEQLLREKTEQYKMYPSEKVWKGIHGSLHTKRRWFISGMFLLVTGILFFAGRDLLFPSKAELSKRTIVSAGTPAIGTDNENSSPLMTAASGQRRTSSIAGRHSGQSSDDQSHKGINVGLIDPAVRQRDISEMLSQVVALPAEPPSIPLIADLRMPSLAVSAAEENAQTPDRPGTGNASTAFAVADRSTSYVSMPPAASTVTENAKDPVETPARIAKNIMSRHTLAETRSIADPAAGHGSVDSSRRTAGGSVVFTDEIADQQRINWLYDYAVYSLPAAAKKGRKYFQLYFSPTATYRRLSGGVLTNKSGTSIGNPKDYLEHGPALGFEVGGAYMYRITRNLTVKAGLQFNYMRYAVKARANMNLPSPDMRSPYGLSLDTANLPVPLRKPYSDSRSQISLTNDFYQLSAPIGFELRVMGNERLQLNVGASIQPGYLLNTNVYYLTSDYGSYVKGPSQFRRWNLTGGVEAFLSYKLHNNLRLQAGPEFRYQLLSSFYNSYPIQENLKGYGFKIGIVKAIP
ncbi:MAG TPA: outer membrane beta-barrel protein [Puia sp.]|nr:outer membrane beta-barrel protein [Puia sp.]